MLLVLALMGCQQQVLDAVGAITGITVNPRAAGSLTQVHAVRPAPVEVQVAALDAPPIPPPESETVAGAEGARAARADFNPISMPEGPRDSPGVRWDGVRTNKSNLVPATGSARERRADR